VAGLGLAGGMSFGVLTLNLWNINEPLEPRYRALSKGLKKLRPEIVCLQEVHRDPKSGRSQAHLIAEMCGLAHHVEKSDLAILCSQPLVRLNSAALPQFKGDTRRHVLQAESVIEGLPLLVINTHLAYLPEMIEGRRRQAEALLAAIKRQHSTPRRVAKILCGDFNDVANSPAVCAVLNSDEQFCDVFAECHPNKPGFTYSPRNQYVDRSWTVDVRIDYIFVSGDLVPKDCAVVFDGNNGLDFVSDHFGVFCNLQYRRAVSQRR
jgi:endonuclease/exonuclease/phosphatase family metal-dependent hydrolase